MTKKVATTERVPSERKLAFRPAKGFTKVLARVSRAVDDRLERDRQAAAQVAADDLESQVLRKLVSV